MNKILTRNQPSKITCKPGELNDIYIMATGDHEEVQNTEIHIPAKTIAHITLITTTSTNLDIDLKGKEASAHISTLAIAQHQDKIHLNCTINMQEAHTQANVTMKAMAHDTATINQEGCMRVEQGTSETQAHLEQDALIMSNKAHIINTPKLEIHTQHTQSTHCAHTTHLTEDDTYYLETKGLTREEITQLTTSSAINKILSNIQSEETRKTAKDDIESTQKKL